MKSNHLFKAFAAFLSFTLVFGSFSACSNPSKDAEIGSGINGLVSPTPAPKVEYTTTQYIRYWPENASYDDCDYSAVIEMPEFKKTYKAGYNMNAAVNAYFANLQDRIENQYMKKATVQKPHTLVTLAVEYIPGCTNVIFTEKHSYIENEYTRTHVLMLNDYGREMNIRDVFLDYHAVENAAKLVADAQGINLYNALERIDASNGIMATLAGCRIFFRPKNPEAAGEIEQVIDLTFDDLSPASRFSGINVSEYEKLEQLIHFAADAAVVRQENITGGSLSAFEASSFMGEFIHTFGIAPEAGRLNVNKDIFESYYSNIFGNEFPGLDENGHDIKFENGVYRILYSPKPYEYHIDVSDFSVAGDIITLTGDLMFGSYGYAFSSYVCHVKIVLEKNAKSPYGFKLVDFIMNI